MVKLVATLSSYGRRAVVVGGVADRYAGELARAGQSNRQRAGTGSASPQRATRPPLWPAGMAEGDRATFGPRVGLSSHGSPAKGGPKSKCLARVKIARTSAGPRSLTISDPSRFPRLPRPGEDRSDVGGTAQFNNIGPVPFSPLSASKDGQIRKKLCIFVHSQTSPVKLAILVFFPGGGAGPRPRSSPGRHAGSSRGFRRP